MKKILLTLIIVLLGNVIVAENFKITISGNSSPMAMKFDVRDTVLFDLANANVTANYIDVPVSIVSENIINTLDFALKFNLTAIAYDSIINHTSYLTPVFYYNPQDATLRFTSNSFTEYAHNIPLVSVRFYFKGSYNPSCNSRINKTDFDSFEAYLNGRACNFKITNAASIVPLANFTTNKICAGTNTTFNDASTAKGGTISSWSWNLGNGSSSLSQNPVAYYASVGDYTITLTITVNSGCINTISKSIKVNPLPVSNFTSVADCKTGTVVFTNNSITPAGTISNWMWNFGDADSSTLKNPLHTYISGGTYTVSLTAVSDSGCASIYTNPVFINKPVAKFITANPKFCIGSSINFRDSSTTSTGTIDSWKWYFGDGNTSTQQNPFHTYSLAGSFTVSLKITTSQNCADSTSKIITIDNPPVVKFGADNLSGCAPLNVTLSDSSVTAPGSVYYWSFVGGNFSSKNITHTFLSSGIYTIKHYVVTPGGCSDSLIKTAYINVSGSTIARFKVTNGCFGSTTIFTDSSTIASGTITNWKWYFGDGNTSTLQHPAHIYAVAGTYTVSLAVTNGTNCSDSVSKIITIGNKPSVKFAGNNLSGCAPLNVNFSDSSITTIGSSYLWHFGDGAVSSLKNATHMYTSGGVYGVKLVVSSSAGCTDSIIKAGYITVKSTATANFTVTNRCIGSSVFFKDSSKISSGAITGWNWYFGDGNTSPKQNPSYIYGSAGTYTVSLKIITSQNCSDSISKTITIESKPLINFSGTVLSGCVPLDVAFSDSSVTAPGSDYFWNFGDSGVSFSKNTVHTYLSTGTYTVKHYITTTAGCSDSLIKPAYITVADKPFVYFTASPKITRLSKSTINFSNLSKNYTNSLWNFGDSALSNRQNPSHLYTNTGHYSVCLRIENTAGCHDTYCDTITVLDANIVAIPKAFTPNNDNSNDLLRVRGGPMSEMEFRVFNEWGNQVFFSTSQNEGWDGNFSGSPQPEGVYEYILNGTTTSNENIKMHGIITLLR